MRTTLSLDDDVHALLGRLQKARRLSFKEAVNQALREGLVRMVPAKRRRKPYRIKPVSLGRCSFASLDDIATVLGDAEDERLP